MGLGAVAVGLTAFWGASSAVAANEQVEMREVAAIELKLASAPGSAVHLTGQVVDWNKPNQVTVTVNGEEHQLELTVGRTDGAGEVNAKVGYWHNGKVVIPEQSLVLPLDSERTVKAKEQSASLSLSVKPKQIPVRKKLEIEDGNDPLGGL